MEYTTFLYLNTTFENEKEKKRKLVTCLHSFTMLASSRPLDPLCEKIKKPLCHFSFISILDFLRVG